MLSVSSRIIISEAYSRMSLPYEYIRTSLVAQTVKNFPAMHETLVRFLDQEDPLEKG